MICLVLLSISEQLLFSHIITQWSSDGKIGIVHVSLGAVAGFIGMIGVVLLVRRKITSNEKSSGKQLIKVIALYIGLQLLAAVIQGLIGEGLGRFTTLEYDVIRTIIHWLVGIMQIFIRIVFIYILVINYYHFKFKEQKGILLKGMLSGIPFCILLFVLRFTLINTALQICQILWEIMFILFFIIYFGENTREKVKNE